MFLGRSVISDGSSVTIYDPTVMAFDLASISVYKSPTVLTFTDPANYKGVEYEISAGPAIVPAKIFMNKLKVSSWIYDMSLEATFTWLTFTVISTFEFGVAGAPAGGFLILVILIMQFVSAATASKFITSITAGVSATYAFLKIQYGLAPKLVKLHGILLPVSRPVPLYNENFKIIYN